MADSEDNFTDTSATVSDDSSEESSDTSASESTDENVIKFECEKNKIKGNYKGKGSTGSVYYVNVNGIDAAMKVFTEDEKHTIDSTIAKIDSPYIIKVFDNIKCNDNTFAVFYEYIEGDNMTKAFLEVEGSIEACFLWMYQLCLGVKTMHENNIIHRDIKPENIMVYKTECDENIDPDRNACPIYNIKIIDFDLSCTELDIGGIPKCENDSKGTPNTSAPEVYKRGDILDYKKTDIYSLGAVFFYLLNRGTYPVIARDVIECVWKKCSGDINQSQSSTIYINQSNLTDDLSKIIDPMINKMLSINPAERPDIDEIIYNIRNFILKDEHDFADNIKEAVY